MMRIVRRTLRQWKCEFLSFWGRFTAFHRIVIGILLAIAIVFTARQQVLDPLEHELAAMRKELSDDSVLLSVPAPEDDSEIQEDTLRAENLQRSLESLETELAQVEAASKYWRDAGKADANAVLLGLAGQHGLHVLKNVSAETPVIGPVPAAASDYELAGCFLDIYDFLTGMQQESLLWELHGLFIGQLNDDDVFSRSTVPRLLLRFTLVQHLYQGEGE